MTEENAKKKWCPMAAKTKALAALVAVIATANSNDATKDKATENTVNETAGAEKCIASDCMMWVTTDNETRPYQEGHKKPASQPAGHCGLINI